MAEDASIYYRKSSSRLYRSLRNGDITRVMQAYAEASSSLDAILKLIPTVHNDTILHMAIYMKQPEIAEEIIKNWHNCSLDLIIKSNDFGNTALHEAAATEYIWLVKQLLEKVPELLSIPNNNGEMPLYTAAYFGQTKTFKFLAEKIEKDDLHRHLCSLFDPTIPHKVRDTVLHAAINSAFFELALLIARNYGQIILLEDKNSKRCLELLSSNPSAFRSGTKYGLIQRFIYYCAPYENDEEDACEQNLSGDSNAESSNSATLFLRPVVSFLCIQKKIMSFLRRVMSSVNRSVWNVLQEWSIMRNIYEDKKKHVSALELAKLLIVADPSWDTVRSGSYVIPNITAGGVGPGEEGLLSGIAEADETGADKTTPTLKGRDISNNPLLNATSHGIIEIVEEMLQLSPSAFEYRNEKKQNLLHLAIMHRHSHIFNRVIRKMKILTSRLVRQLDDKRYTILHHVGNMEFYNGGTRPGPALQLQEELEWYEKVAEIIPPHYATIRVRNEEKETLQEYFHRKYEEFLKEWSSGDVEEINPPHLTRNRDEEKMEETPEMYFYRTHGGLLKEAQEWLKQTSESCSTVAGLMATVAFAAAFTVPGGNNDRNGEPRLVHHPFFLVFIITDALSLVSSLTSLVMFLSILTSPFELHDFRHSLPRKLIFGFSLLFISVAVTMLAFASTLMLTIPIRRRLTTSLIYCVAFVPVTMFALLQFPLYVAFKTSIEYSRKAIPSLQYPLYVAFKTSIGSLLKAIPFLRRKKTHGS